MNQLRTFLFHEHHSSTNSLLYITLRRSQWRLLIRQYSNATTTNETGKVPSIKITPSPFDTYIMINKLQELGFTKVQSEGLVSILSQLATEQTNAKIQSKDLELLELKMNGLIETIKHSQSLLEQSSIVQLKESSRELQAEIGRLKELIKDEVKRVNGGVQLDINLERSRNKEHETIIDQRIKDTHNRIDNEIAQIKLSMESVKLDMLKYLSGGIVTIVTVMVSIVMGIWRLSK